MGIMDITRTRARRMGTTGLIGSRTAFSLARGRGSVAAFTADGASATSVGIATLTITGAGSTVAETSVVGETSVVDAVASFAVDLAVTSMVAETSTAATHSAVVATTSMAVAASMVDMEGAGPMAAGTADTGKFLNGSTPQTVGSTLCRPFSFVYELEELKRFGLVRTHRFPRNK